VIGASAGGLSALDAILSTLPSSLPAAVAIVVHTRSDGVLPRVLARRSRLPVEAACDLATLRPGTVYVAPADRHLLITKSGLRVVRGPRENGLRPAIDPLFRTAARARGARVVGVILSGALDDGSHGLAAIVRRGGAAVVQDPDEAEVPSMPLAALRRTRAHAVAPAARIAQAIVQLCREPVGDESESVSRRDPSEQQRPADETQVADVEALLGPPTPITCPACGGALWESHEDGVVRYACHVGHQYGPDSLLAEHGHSVEHALWSAVRVLEQHAELRQRMSRRAHDAGIATVAQRFAEDGRDYHGQAQSIRRLIFGPHDRVTADVSSTRRKARAR
jgi:two-component system chemotaxis response regulator CheB